MSRPVQLLINEQNVQEGDARMMLNVILSGQKI